MSEILIPLMIIAILVILNGIFVAAEFSIVSAPRMKVFQEAENGSKSAKHVLDVLNDPIKQNQYITTAQVGITIVSLGLGMYGEHEIAGWLLSMFENNTIFSALASHSIATVISVGLLTYVHVVIGEMIPKSFSLQSSLSTVLILSRPMVIMEKLFFPFVWVLNHISSIILKIFDFPTNNEEDRLFSSDDIEFIVEESFEEGLIEESDQLFIENILDLEERTVEQAMTPRNKIISLASNTSFNETLSLVCDTNKTRYPVFQENLDNVIGVLHLKDLARIIVREAKEGFDLSTIVRPVIYVPESLHLDELLIRFRREHLQIAIAFDEFGGTAGIITMEDLVEEVVGEIQDEFDEENIPIEVVNIGLLRVRGDVILDELEQLYNLRWGKIEATTIGGLVMESLGRIPEIGDQVDIDGTIIEVESLDGLAVNSVKIIINSG